MILESFNFSYSDSGCHVLSYDWSNFRQDHNVNCISLGSLMLFCYHQVISDILNVDVSEWNNQLIRKFSQKYLLYLFVICSDILFSLDLYFTLHFLENSNLVSLMCCDLNYLE